METRRMVLAHFCFAWSGLILFASIAFNPLLLVLCFATWFVIALFGIGWYYLVTAVLSPGPGGLESARVPLLVCVASLAGCGAALSATPWMFESIGFPLGPLSVLLSGVFLFVPLVYAPILVGHSALLFMAAGDASRFSRTSFRVGALALLGIAVVGVAAQVLLMTGQGEVFLALFTTLPGLTGPVYTLTAVGWWKELRLSGKTLFSGTLPT